MAEEETPRRRSSASGRASRQRAIERDAARRDAGENRDATPATSASPSTTAGAVAPGTPASPHAARDLEAGATGDDVRALQVFLNAAGFTLAAEGPGSPGSETDRFGALTRAALARWQAANGVAPAAGYYGPKTRAAIAAREWLLLRGNSPRHQTGPSVVRRPHQKRKPRR